MEEARVDRVGIERLCLFGMPPVEHVNLAADLDCRYIGIGLAAMRYYNPHGYPDWSLKADPILRRTTAAAARDRGVQISLVEGFGLRPGLDVREYAADLDVVCELGGVRINAVSTGRDLARTCDGFAILAEMAGARGLQTTIEIGPGPIRDLAAAMTAVRHVGRADFRLLVDTMHFFRFGGRAEELAALDPQTVGYVQLCDAPLTSGFASYMEEALHERLNPGEGELPLLAALQALPGEVVVSVEVPQRSRAEAGQGPLQRVGATVAAARRLLAAAR
jgi:sugar phosphate isomerase/epimerase